MGALDNGLKHVIQAGIDRANQVSSFNFVFVFDLKVCGVLK
jgi:hypothetical protein